MKTNNIVKPNRYLAVLREQSKSAINKVQKEFNVQLNSSAELNEKVQLQDLMGKKQGVIFKNLGIVVLDDIDEGQLSRSLAANTSPVIYYEKEKEFKTASSLEKLTEAQHTGILLQQQLAELEEIIKEQEDKNHEDFHLTWGLEVVGLAKSKFTGKGIDIAVLDTGFYLDHPDFQGRNIQGKSFIQGEDWDKDGKGHGTHCTGTAAGNISHIDGRRYGVANESNIVIGKVLSNAGTGSTSGIIDAIDWAIEKDFKVISMSLGMPVGVGEPPSFIFEHVGQTALAKNILLVAAAGNNSSRPSLPRPVSSPANAESIMAIAALDQQLRVANFSNGGINAANGGRIDLSGPGVGVFSSFSKLAPNGSLYATLKGTSMATPHVSGVAALYFEAYPDDSASEIWRKLEKRTKQLSGQLIRDVGQGLIQTI